MHDIVSNFEKIKICIVKILVTFPQTHSLIFLNFSLMSDSDSDESVTSLVSTSAEIVDLTTAMIQEKLDLLSEKRYFLFILLQKNRRAIREKALESLLKYLSYKYCDELLTDIYTTFLDDLLSVIRKQRGTDFFLACKCLNSLMYTSGSDWEDAVKECKPVFQGIIKSELENDEILAESIFCYTNVVFCCNTEEGDVKELLDLLMYIITTKDYNGTLTIIKTLQSLILIISNYSSEEISSIFKTYIFLIIV